MVVSSGDISGHRSFRGAGLEVWRGSGGTALVAGGAREAGHRRRRGGPKGAG
jgi:hypothetical protein